MGDQDHGLFTIPHTTFMYICLLLNDSWSNILHFGTNHDIFYALTILIRLNLLVHEITSDAWFVSDD